MLSQTYELDSGRTMNDIRVYEILKVSINSPAHTRTVGLFDIRKNVREQALEELSKFQSMGMCFFCREPYTIWFHNRLITRTLVTTIFILVVWIIGVIAFAGPIMTLVVEPIERMVLLLSMLMKDPLGYQK